MNQARPLLHKIDVKQSGNGIKRTGLFVCRCKGNRPLELRAVELEFFLMEEVLHEKLKLACCLVNNSNLVEAKGAYFMTT